MTVPMTPDSTVDLMINLLVIWMSMGIAALMFAAVAEGFGWNEKLVNNTTVAGLILIICGGMAGIGVIIVRFAYLH